MSLQSGDSLDINWDEDVDLLRGMNYSLIIIADSEEEDDIDENEENVEEEEVKEVDKAAKKRKRDEKEIKGIELKLIYVERKKKHKKTEQQRLSEILLSFRSKKEIVFFISILIVREICLMKLVNLASVNQFQDSILSSLNNVFYSFLFI